MALDDAELDQVLREITTVRELELEDELAQVGWRLDAVGAQLEALRDQLDRLISKVEADGGPTRPGD